MNYKRKIFAISVLLVAVSLFNSGFCQDTVSNRKPVNPNISAEAEALLDLLYNISGKYILAGHHNGINMPDRFNEEVKQVTGKYPAVWGCDFSFNFMGNDPDVIRQQMIDKAIELHSKGYIITLMWHSCFPTEGDSCSPKTIWIWDDIIPQEQWIELTTEGTELNNKWRAQADNVAKYLRQLQEAHVPVLWRPYHEMNGVWFWWCQHPGDEGFARLWKMMYDYFTNHHQLNNLLWVWDANAPRDRKNDEAYAYKDYFPGLDYIDVLASDVYHNDFRQSHHDELLEVADGKPVSLGEVGQMPTPELLDQQPRWTWFMGWAEWLHKANTPEAVRALYNSPRTITLDEISIDDSGRYVIKPE